MFNLSRRDQILSGFLILLIIGLIFFRFLFLPTNQEIKSFSQENLELKAEIKNLEAQIEQTPPKQKDSEESYADLDIRLPSDGDMIALLSFLDDTSAQYGLYLDSIDFRGAEELDEVDANNLVFNIATKGAINSLLKYLHELENADRLISVGDVSLDALKIEKLSSQDASLEPKAPSYYISPPGIPEAKLQRIKLEVVEEENYDYSEAEKTVASGIDKGNYALKLTIRAYYTSFDTDIKKLTEEKTSTDGEV